MCELILLKWYYNKIWIINFGWCYFINLILEYVDLWEVVFICWVVVFVFFSGCKGVWFVVYWVVYWVREVVWEIVWGIFCNYLKLFFYKK